MLLRSLVLIIITLASSLNSIQVPFSDCDRVNTAAAFKSIVLLNCVEEPCSLKPKKDLEFEIQMELNHTVPMFFLEIGAYYYDKHGLKTRLDSLTVQPPNCKQNKCKIRAGDVRCVHPKMRALEKIPGLYDMQTILYDHKHNRVSCASYILRIASW